MRGFLAVAIACVVCLGALAMDAKAGELRPIQKPDCVQKCPIPAPTQKCVQKPDCVQKCPPACKCLDCVPVKFRMTLHSRIRLRRASRKAACAADKTIEACYLIDRCPTVRVCAPGVAVSVGGCCQ